jgi:alpha-L-fucosidase
MRTNCYRITVTVLIIGALSMVTRADVDDLFFRDRLQPLSVDNIFKTEGYYNWGASIIKGQDTRYHLFYSRWKKIYTFTGWLTHSEIAHAVSDTPCGPWAFRETVLQGRGPGHWDAITAHNPKIKYFDGQYYLYYIATNLGGRDYTEQDLIETARTGYSHPNWKILRPNQRTGVAVSASLNGPWQRMDMPLVEPAGPITTLTVNPAIDRGPDGRYYLIVKGDKPNEMRFIRNQAMAIADTPTGPFVVQSEPVIDTLDTEDMSLWYDGSRQRFYGVFHAHRFIGMVTSPNGRAWKKAAEYVLLPKALRLGNGEALIPDRLERPFVFTEDGEPRVLSLAVKKAGESYSVFIPIKTNKIPVPNQRQRAWQEAELGVVFHYDLHVFDGQKYRQGGNRISPMPDHQIFNPRQLDTDQWIRAAKAAGARFAILTATHETGFALYQSDVNPYCLKAVNWRRGRGDIVREFVDSCRKYGLKPGLYVGIRWNAFYGVHDFQVNGEGPFRDNRQQWYRRLCEGMVRELCTRYGELFEIWFDGGADHPDNGAPDVLPIVQQFQPNCLFYHNGQLAEARWGGSESGTVAYPCWATFPYPCTGAGESARKDIARNGFALLKQGDPVGPYWMPAMSDAPLRGYKGRHEWFWEPGDEAHVFPLENLMNMYTKSVGRNSTLIMGLTPDPNGLLPVPDVRRLKEWGDEIRRIFGKPLASTQGKGTTLELHFTGQETFDHVVLQEDIRHGERVRRYTLEILENGQWQELATGSCIGHKRIHRLSPHTGAGVRLVVDDSLDTPLITLLAVHNGQN